MSRYEKLTCVFSALALLVAIAWPFVSYYWFDPSLQTFQNRGRLRIRAIESPSTPVVNLDVEQQKGDIGNLWREFWRISRLPWKIEIENIGKMPAKDVQIILHYDGPAGPAPEPNDIRFEPPFELSFERQGDDVQLTLKRPIPSQEKIIMVVRPRPTSLWVFNEFGEGSSIINLPDTNVLIESWMRNQVNPTEKSPPTPPGQNSPATP